MLTPVVLRVLRRLQQRYQQQLCLPLPQPFVQAGCPEQRYQHQEPFPLQADRWQMEEAGQGVVPMLPCHRAVHPYPAHRQVRKASQSYLVLLEYLVPADSAPSVLHAQAGMNLVGRDRLVGSHDPVLHLLAHHGRAALQDRPSLHLDPALLPLAGVLRAIHRVMRADLRAGGAQSNQEGARLVVVLLVVGHLKEVLLVAVRLRVALLAVALLVVDHLWVACLGQLLLLAHPAVLLQLVLPGQVYHLTPLHLPYPTTFRGWPLTPCSRWN